MADVPTGRFQPICGGVAGLAPTLPCAPALTPSPAKDRVCHHIRNPEPGSLLFGGACPLIMRPVPRFRRATVGTSVSQRVSRSAWRLPVAPAAIVVLVSAQGPSAVGEWGGPAGHGAASHQPAPPRGHVEYFAENISPDWAATEL